MLVQVLIVILLFIYFTGTRNFDYWKKKGVTHCKPLPFFGNSLKKYLQKISPTNLLADIYKKYPNERYVGCFESNRPALVLRDPELIKCVLVTDFQSFYAKGINSDENEPLLNNLFSADGDVWKLFRQKLTFAFTTNKLKSMFPAILTKAEQAVAIIKQNGAEMNVRDLTARYTIDAITVCGFGIDTDALNNNSSVFITLGKRLFNITSRDAVVTAGKFLAPEVFKHAYHFAPEIENQMSTIFKYLIKARDEKQSGRKDFMDILISIKENKKLIGHSIAEINEDGTKKYVEIEVNDSLLIAQAFILFGAGYETTSSVISFALHQFAYHPDKQTKCQKEIDEIIEKYGEITYDSMNDMKYLDMCINEVLRMYPPVGFFMRKCTRKYTFPNTNLTIDKGVTVLIPTQGIQNDPKYFEDPDEFIPERFHPDNLDKIPKHVFIPFGEGPRVCIGQRLGNIQAKICLAAILRECAVVPSANSRRKLTSDPTTALVQNVRGGVPLTFVAREMAGGRRKNITIR